MLINILVTQYVTSNEQSDPASGRGARVSVCAGLINQLQSCRFDPINAWQNDYTAIVSYWWMKAGGHNLCC